LVLGNPRQARSRFPWPSPFACCCRQFEADRVVGLLIRLGADDIEADQTGQPISDRAISTDEIVS
jgi:hypothetical protein